MDNNIEKYETDDYGMFDEFMNEDFALIIYNGSVLPLNNPNYDKNRVEIEIYNQNKYLIRIDGKEYEIKNEVIFLKIKELIDNNFDQLITYAKMQTKDYISQNILLGCNRSITIKHGNLLINLNGALKDSIGNFCEELIQKIKDIIINE